MSDRVANIQNLCDEEGVENPIDEQVLIHGEYIFDVPGRKLIIQPTDMNRAGRLFIQAHFRKQGRLRILQLTHRIKEEAASFFTAELWDDCSPERRPLIWGIKHSDVVRAKPK